MSKRGATRLAVYEYIYKRISEGGSSPTVRDICAALKLKSTSTAHLHIDNLRSEGYIDFDDNLQRTIRLTDKVPTGAKVSAPKQENASANIPLIGTVAAGNPVYAFDDLQYTYALPKELLRSAEPAETFLLTVDGESMIDAGILTGDRILVTKSFSFKDGDIVVARVSGDSATVKRIYYEGKNIRLQPENKNMEPILCPASEVEVIGKVIGLIRSY
ncbi:MAG: transcriptional repressor LexA [Clostridia bacterium]|nr:transcriptional repressor LexA [Clostridia bacterium]